MTHHFKRAALLGLAGWLLLAGFSLSAAPKKNAKSSESPNTAVTNTPYLTPEQERATIQLPPGYHLELVLADPVIREPVLTVFDGDGRMFVAEMRTYMQNIDGVGQLTNKSRISMHWSSHHNGIYDKHSVFIDGLLLPRMILPVADGILVNETESDDIWYYHFAPGKNVAGKKELFHAGGKRGGNLEHQASGLIWDLDNWMYMAVNAYRLNWDGKKVTQEPTPPNFGQWGIAQDDYGKLWFVNASGEYGPVSYQQPIVYGNFSFPEQTGKDWAAVWPLVGLADVQGGTPRFRASDKTLNHFSGTCGIEIYRGDALPADARGDLFFCEPVGRLIRRAKVENRDGITYLRNAYTNSEFLRSSDPNFRPVNVANAPDGALYITDMYRGIIQEANWVGTNSYLRGVVKQYGLEKNFGRGRIWRLVHDGNTFDAAPHMSDESTLALVGHLASANGWWRDTAQKLIVLRGDKSVEPALLAMAQKNPTPLTRIHAIWTLEGLHLLTPELVREKIHDQAPEVRIAAIRASESLYKAGDHSLIPDLVKLATDSNSAVAIQVMLTANLLKWPDYQALLIQTAASSASEGLKKIVDQLFFPPDSPAGSEGITFSDEEKKTMQRGQSIYQQLCFACHGLDGHGIPFQGSKPGATIAPALGRAPTVIGDRDGVISVVLKGLGGPVDGKIYDAQMVPMENNDDQWLADVISYIRNSFHNHATFVTTNDIARVRVERKEHVGAWTLAELRATIPQPLTNRSQWKLTANHNAETLKLAIDGDPKTRYDTRMGQTPGMWVQIELPEATPLCGIHLDAGSSVHDYPRGYKVELSTDGLIWGKPVATGGDHALEEQISFEPQVAKFVRITQTGSDKSYYWSIYEMQLLQPPTTTKIN